MGLQRVVVQDVVGVSPRGRGLLQLIAVSRLHVSVDERGIELLEVPGHRTPPAVPAVAPIFATISRSGAGNAEVPVHAPVLAPDFRIKVVRAVYGILSAARPSFGSLIEVRIDVAGVSDRGC